MKRLLLTTTALAAITGAASAADLPTKGPAPMAPAYVAPSWTGFWIGGHVGGARMNTSATTVGSATSGINCGMYNGSCAGSDTSFVGGVEAGYDWQHGTFVYGIAGDWTWTDFKNNQSRFENTSAWVNQHKIDWLASFRGRMGLAVQDTMVYVTGGVAVGHVKTSATFSDQTPANFRDYGTVSKNKVGWVAGGGVEHRWNRNWSFKAEALYYDLGHTDVTAVNTAGSYTTTFNHEVIVGRVGVSYRF